MKIVHNIGIAALLSVLAGLSTSATEIANLRNGFSIRHERHEAMDNVTRLYLTRTQDNYVDVPTDEIVNFEKDDALPPTRFRPMPAPSLDDVVRAASSRNNIDPDLINSVIRAESGFDPNAVSPKGAQGLMQLMPQTAFRLGVENALDPASNVEGGTRYLRELLARYDNDLIKALAAYNAGPERVQQYNGIPPYRETLSYVSRVIHNFNRKKLGQRSPQLDAATVRGVENSSKPTTLRAAHPAVPQAGVLLLCGPCPVSVAVLER